MIPEAEKRKEDRFECSCTARYSIFAKSMFYDSKILDFSDSGMRVRTRIPANIGSFVLIQATPQASDIRSGSGFLCPSNRSIGIGQVRWCAKANGNEAAGYDLGLKLHPR